jgi:UDP-N-acetylmuramoyl-tripeptide--D-alanyl-D-alanine ligase
MNAAVPLMTLADAAGLLPRARLVGAAATPIERVHSDSRTLRAGDLFVALVGERFDGHDFLPQAKAAGAAAALASRGLAEAGLPGLQVDDTLVALQALAAGWRARCTLPLIAVTGSNGKTTVTQMIAAILGAWLGDAALATAGNLNNHIGVPLTLLRLRQDAAVWHRAAVLELGMNHPGEIAQLAALARPTVALVNNAQREHQEFMASVDAVARENGAVIAALGADGVAVYPADDPMSAVWRALAGQRASLTFATAARTDVSAEASWRGDDAAGHWAVRARTPAGAIAFALHAPGQHNLRNALAATAAALAAGAPPAAIASGLERFRPVAGRSQARRVERAGAAFTLIDDSYNANPDSVRAAIDLLATLPAPQWLLLGDMGEVGDQGPAFHREVGAHARARGIGRFWCVGDASADAAAGYGAGVRHFARVDDLIAALPRAGEPIPAASVLVKGSRFMRMERVVAALASEARHAP